MMRIEVFEVVTQKKQQIFLVHNQCSTQETFFIHDVDGHVICYH